MNPRVLNVLGSAAGAAAGYLAADWLERRRAEKRTLTEADMKWVAATHADPGPDGKAA